MGATFDLPLLRECALSNTFSNKTCRALLYQWYILPPQEDGVFDAGPRRRETKAGKSLAPLALPPDDCLPPLLQVGVCTGVIWTTLYGLNLVKDTEEGVEMPAIMDPNLENFQAKVTAQFLENNTRMTTLETRTDHMDVTQQSFKESGHAMREEVSQLRSSMALVSYTRTTVSSRVTFVAPR